LVRRSRDGYGWAGFSAGGVAGTVVGGCAVVAPGAGFAGAAVVGGWVWVWGVLVPPGGGVDVLRQPPNVNAARAKIVNAVSTTFLMVFPFL